MPRWFARNGTVRKLDWNRAGKVMARKLVIDGGISIRPGHAAKKVLSTTPSAASNCGSSR